MSTRKGNLVLWAEHILFYFISISFVSHIICKNPLLQSISKIIQIWIVETLNDHLMSPNSFALSPRGVVFIQISRDFIVYSDFIGTHGQALTEIVKYWIVTQLVCITTIKLIVTMMNNTAKRMVTEKRRQNFSENNWYSLMCKSDSNLLTFNHSEFSDYFAPKKNAQK